MWQKRGCIWVNCNCTKQKENISFGLIYGRANTKVNVFSSATGYVYIALILYFYILHLLKL